MTNISFLVAIQMIASDLILKEIGKNAIILTTFGIRFFPVTEAWCAVRREGSPAIEFKSRTSAIHRCRGEFPRHRVPSHVAGRRYRGADTFYPQMGLLSNDVQRYRCSLCLVWINSSRYNNHRHSFREGLQQHGVHPRSHRVGQEDHQKRFDAAGQWAAQIFGRTGIVRFAQSR